MLVIIRQCHKNLSNAKPVALSRNMGCFSTHAPT